MITYKTKNMNAKNEKVIKAIVELVNSTKEKNIKLECGGNYPIVPDETIILYDDCAVRFAGERSEYYGKYTTLNDGEVEVLIDALNENGYSIESTANGDYKFKIEEE